MPIRSCPKPYTEAGKRRGTIHKEEKIEVLEGGRKDYYKVAQLLEWDYGAWSIRFGYYLKPHGAKEDKYHWGSQTTSIISINHIDDLIKVVTGLKETYEGMRRK